MVSSIPNAASIASRAGIATNGDPTGLPANFGNGTDPYLIPKTSATVRHVIIINTGVAPGFFSLDGGLSWHYLPASPNGSSISIESNHQPISLQNGIVLNRIFGGGDMTGVFGSAW